MGLISKLFWLALFLVSTFCFLVLFEHGPRDFSANAQIEFANLRTLTSKKIERKKDDSDKIGH
jgi:hypothetical protein